MLGQLSSGVARHVIVFDERQLRRLLRNYVAYYHDDRTHLGLGKATPEGGRWRGGLMTETPTSSRCHG